MGFRIVRVPSEALAGLLFTGCVYPGANRWVEVSDGLPEGAELVGAELEFGTNYLLLKYSHPSWGSHRPGSTIEHMRPTYTEYSVTLETLKGDRFAIEERMDGQALRLEAPRNGYLSKEMNLTAPFSPEETASFIPAPSAVIEG